MMPAARLLRKNLSLQAVCDFFTNVPDLRLPFGAPVKAYWQLDPKLNVAPSMEAEPVFQKTVAMPQGPAAAEVDYWETTL
jgi:hypothetical protein